MNTSAYERYGWQSVGATKSINYIPTWTVGITQTMNGDYARWSEQGYSRNTLIYACIQLLANSFAALPPVIVRNQGDANDAISEPDEIIRNHPVIDLIEHPNEEADGYEFRVNLATHLLVAGNAYIQKIRDRLSAPYQLQLIRPDYVEIKPGTSRERDLFEIKIDGQIKARIPRRDMIHVKLPNPANDFYGLSPIQVLAEAGDLDLRMTEFERTFFMNAGVPFGILTTRTRHSEDQLKEIRSRWRTTFNGLRNFFQLLILNAEEAKYQQLGMNQNDMEMEGTRDHIESRICAVFFSTPPMLVGANVGLKRATYSNYDQAEVAFWSETMPPFIRLIASPLTRDLLSEFATVSDARSRLAFDTSTVQALQDDNVKKLKAAADILREVKTIIPVNQVLSLVGLPKMEGGDVVVIETPAQPQQSFVEAPPPAGAEQRQLTARRMVKEAVSRSFLDASLAARAQLVERAVPELHTTLQTIAGRVRERMEGGRKDAPVTQDADSFIDPLDEALFFAALLPFAADAIRSGWVFASFEFGIEETFDEESTTVQRLLADAANHVQGITQETRDLVARHIAEGIANGWTLQQIIEGDGETPGLMDIHAFSESRARMIAITEISAAQNRGSVARWRDSGLVKEVIVYDGDGCGWTSHDDPTKANGRQVTLDEFEAMPYAHPNCIRSATPIRGD